MAYKIRSLKLDFQHFSVSQLQPKINFKILKLYFLNVSFQVNLTLLLVKDFQTQLTKVYSNNKHNIKYIFKLNKKKTFFLKVFY